MPKQRATTPREPLTRERVLRAAIAFVDENGLESLSMRRLGQELGVEAMSLYNHVASKDDLLNGITDLVLQEIDLPPEGDWKPALRRSAISAYEVFRRHPWACSLTLAPGRVAPTAVRRADWMLKTFRDAGFTPELTYHAYHALDAHVLGFTLWQVSHGIPDETRLAELVAGFFRMFPEEDYPYMHEHARQHLDGVGRGRPGAFEIVLDLILDGFERMRDAE